MKLLPVFLLSACFFFPPAPASGTTAYLVTEEELEQLEIISESYRTDRQRLQSQVQSLQQRAERLNLTSGNLQSLLNQEREQTKSLRQSLNQLEADLSALADQNSRNLLEVERTKTDLQKVKNQRNLAVLSIVAFAAGFTIIKIKKIF